MRFTALRVTTDHRIFLFEGHVRRLGEAARTPLLSFAESAAPGVYRATFDGAQLISTPRGPSALRDGIPTRLAVSPFASTRGRFPKPGPGSPYDAVRTPGVATLLTDPRGTELYEACVASVLAWDGTSLVLPPEDAPGVASVAEAEVLARLSPRRAVIPVHSEWPLLLINAVVGTCAPHVEGRDVFPAAERARVDAALR